MKIFIPLHLILFNKNNFFCDIYIFLDGTCHISNFNASFMSGNLNFCLKMEVFFFLVAAGELFGDLMRELIPVCKQFAVTGTTKQAKQAIRCLYVNLAHGQDAVFSEILEVR